jgi:hypothetical protein
MRLRERQPVRYGGYVAIGGETILSFSPELFFERRGSRVRTRPMKGTAPRGSSPQEDEESVLALFASAKERAENVMIVDLLRNDLGRLAQPGKVRVDALCETEAYPTLWQMVSTVAAELPGTGAGRFVRRAVSLWFDHRRAEDTRHATHRRTGSIAARACIPVPWAGWRPAATVVSTSPFAPLSLTLGGGQHLASAAASSPTPTPARICRVLAQGEFSDRFRSRLRAARNPAPGRRQVSVLSLHLDRCRLRHAAWVLPVRCRRLRRRWRSKPLTDRPASFAFA